MGCDCCKTAPNSCASKLALTVNIIGIIVTGCLSIFYFIATATMEVVLSVVDDIHAEDAGYFDSFSSAAGLGRLVMVLFIIGFSLPVCCIGNAKGMLQSCMFQGFCLLLVIISLAMAGASHGNVQKYEDDCVEYYAEHYDDDDDSYYYYYDDSYSSYDYEASCADNATVIEGMFQAFYICTIIPLVLTALAVPLMLMSKKAFEEAEKQPEQTNVHQTTGNISMVQVPVQNAQVVGQQVPVQMQVPMQQMQVLPVQQVQAQQNMQGQQQFV